jgi:hypothetical protein
MIHVEEVQISGLAAIMGGDLPDADLNTVLQDVAEMARTYWISLADQRLHTTRQTYIAGLQEVEMGDGQATISLLGGLPNMIENGMDAVDMRDTLLGDNVPVVPFGEKGKHRAKNGGYYRAIPFRHGTPGNKQSNVGPKMGSAYSKGLGEARATEIGKAVYAEAKKLAAHGSSPYGAEWAGHGKQTRLPGGVGGAGLLRPHHASDIYKGMVKLEKTYGEGTKPPRSPQAQYMTFRTISTNNTNGWFRQATPGQNFAKEVVAFVNQKAPEAFSKYVEGLLKP